MSLGRKLICLAVFLSLVLAAGCQDAMEETQQSFINLGDFAVNKKDGYTQMRDGVGRILAIVPRGEPHPEGFEPTRVVETPVKRVVVFSDFDIGILRALGEEDTVVGSIKPAEDWHIDYMREAYAEGRVQFVGEADALDYERVKVLKPDMVMTWDPAIVPMMDELGIPVVVTSTPLATCLATRVRFVQFIAPFFHREKEGQAFYDRVSLALETIREKTKTYPKPNAMWGDIYEKRVLVEPGNAWVAELVGLAQSDYLFDDVYGASCIEISMERFIYSGRDADIYFTYRNVSDGVTSKAALLRLNPLLEGLKPLSSEGRAYAPLPHYSQSADRLDEILTEISAILHPQAYPGHELEFFLQLPDEDPAPRAEVR